MKLLIADDEKLTREGIRDSLDLEALGYPAYSWLMTVSTAWKPL